MSKLRNRCLLVVDDDADTRLLLAMALESEGAEVLTAASAKEALDLLAWRKPDALLCDLGLPEVNGCQLLQAIRTKKARVWQRIPAIAVTAYDSKQVQPEALAAGFQLLFTKPIDLDGLTAAIAELTQSKVCDLIHSKAVSALGTEHSGAVENA
ncbi:MULTISPECIES: response regulator [Trichocoleus]|nr:response regulator [Trichocoleus sp. FACHB-46]MBD1865596.1 response regulator [Trichocoleus sp. FACHB-46]